MHAKNNNETQKKNGMAAEESKTPDRDPREKLSWHNVQLTKCA